MTCVPQSACHRLPRPWLPLPLLSALLPLKEICRRGRQNHRNRPNLCMPTHSSGLDRAPDGHILLPGGEEVYLAASLPHYVKGLCRMRSRLYWTRSHKVAHILHAVLGRMCGNHSVLADRPSVCLTLRATWRMLENLCKSHELRTPKTLVLSHGAVCVRNV